MTLFYMNPGDPFPTPPKGSGIEEIKHKKILDNWFAFTDSLEPDFSKLTFFPENILPHDKLTYLETFAFEYRKYKENDELTEPILNALAINVFNLYRFSPLIDKGVHNLYMQNFLDSPVEALKIDKNSLIDNDLIQGLVEGIYKFCTSEGFPKKLMYECNQIFLLGLDKKYSDQLKSLFINETSLNKISQTQENKPVAHKNQTRRKGIGENHPAWTVIKVLITIIGLYLIYIQVPRN